MIRVEIYEKTTKNGQPVKVPQEVKTFKTSRDVERFAHYFGMQCDTKRYGWREVTQ